MRRLRRLSGDRRGMAIVEFAIVAPVMVLLIMGIADLLYRIYAQQLLDGAMQKAGRDSAIQGGGDLVGELDQRVLNMVRTISPNLTYNSTRRSYRNFSGIKPETFRDTNGNNRYDKGECFDDVNGNRQWDADPGIGNQGGASDVTRYTMTISYPRLFPMAGMLGWDTRQTIVGVTLLKNQPYASQAAGTVEAICG